MVSDRGQNRVRTGGLKVLGVGCGNFKIHCLSEKLLKQDRKGNKRPRTLRKEYFRARKKKVKDPEVGACSFHD